MTASLVITFSDGTTRALDLGDKLQEIDLPHHMRQSIAVNQNGQGRYTLAYTKPLMEGKSWTEITIRKDGASTPLATHSQAQGTA
jgi:hypothetical protein